jgi:uncharacterized protein
MAADSQAIVDLDALALRSGQGEVLELDLRPEAPTLTGERLRLADPTVHSRIDVSRTSSGYALRLRFDTAVEGTCARCLGAARLSLAIDAREVDQTSEKDQELLSPYVEEGLLDAGSWARDAIRLALPEQLHCREDCAGLCEECGLDLNTVEPGTHTHERPPDPRFAKLRELTE